MKLVYLDMTPGTNQFTLNMLLTGTTTSRIWKIRISQIPCGANYAGNFIHLFYIFCKSVETAILFYCEIFAL